VSHIPISIERSRKAAAGVASTSEPPRAGMLHAQAPSASPKSTVVENAASRPMAVARAPRIGPSCTPTIAALITPPITCPRRSRGAALASHDMPPPHENAPPTPCTKRAASSSTIEVPKAKTSPLAAMSRRPTSTVALTPTRAESQPPGSDPTSVPAA